MSSHFAASAMVGTLCFVVLLTFLVQLQAVHIFAVRLHPNIGHYIIFDPIDLCSFDKIIPFHNTFVRRSHFPAFFFRPNIWTILCESEYIPICCGIQLRTITCFIRFFISINIFSCVISLHVSIIYFTVPFESRRSAPVLCFQIIQKFRFLFLIGQIFNGFTGFVYLCPIFLFSDKLVHSLPAFPSRLPQSPRIQPLCTCRKRLFFVPACIGRPLANAVSYL